MANNIFTGATDAQWALATNWSLGAVPTANDGNIAVFDATSPTCTLGSSNKVCNHIDFTGYTNTLQFGVRTLTVSGNVVLDPGMTWTGTGVFAVNTSGNITSNGFQSPATLTFGFQGTAQTYTLQDDLTILGACSLNATATNLTINNNGTAKIIYASGNISTAAPGCMGTAKFIMNGTGSISNTGAIRNDFEINTAGTITFGTNVRYASGTFLYTAGTVVTAGSTFTLGLSAVTTTQIDADGIVFNNIVFTGGTGAITTLLSDLNSTGAVSAVSTITLNGFNINIDGSGTYGVGGGGSGIVSGTTVLNFVGATCGWATGTGTNRLAVNINTAGTLTCSGTTIHGTGTVTHIAGTVVTTGHTLTITTSCTLDTDPISWNNISLPSSITITLTTDWTVTGAFTSTGGTTINGSTIHLSGAMTLGGSQTLLGTTTLSLMGGSSWIGGTGFLRLNTNIAAGVGTFTISGTVQYNTGTLTYVSGTLIATGSTINFSAGSTINTNGCVFENVVFNQGTMTLNSLFEASGTVTVATGTSVTFAGTSGFTIGSLICTTVNRSITLKAGITYTVTTNLTLTGTGTSVALRINILSNTAMSYAILTLNSGASCFVKHVNATDIDSSAGRLVTNDKGTLLRTLNWYVTNPDNFLLLM